MNNEETMRKLQGINALLRELIGQADTGEEHRRSQDNPLRTPRQMIRIRTPGLNSQIPEVTDSRRKYGRRARKAHVYKETTENTHSRVPYDPSLYQNKVEHETLSASDVKLLIEEVLEQK